MKLMMTQELSFILRQRVLVFPRRCLRRLLFFIFFLSSSSSPELLLPTSSASSIAMLSVSFKVSLVLLRFSRRCFSSTAILSPPPRPSHQTIHLLCILMNERARAVSAQFHLKSLVYFPIHRKTHQSVFVGVNLFAEERFRVCKSNKNGVHRSSFVSTLTTKTSTAPGVWHDCGHGRRGQTASRGCPDDERVDDARSNASERALLFSSSRWYHHRWSSRRRA